METIFPPDWDHTLACNRFNKICVENQALFKRKNKEYGNAIEETGVIGASVEIVGVIARLKQLVIQDPGHGRGKEEAIENVARDLHNYANILMMMLKSENWEGINENSGSDTDTPT